MDSRRLSTEQVNRLRAQLQRQHDYLQRLCVRMMDLNWRTDDPLLVAAQKAYHAHEDLLRLAVPRRKPGGRLP